MGWVGRDVFELCGGNLFFIVLGGGVLLWELPTSGSFTCRIYDKFRRAYGNGMSFYHVVSLTLGKVESGEGGGYQSLGIRAIIESADKEQ